MIFIKYGMFTTPPLTPALSPRWVEREKSKSPTLIYLWVKVRLAGEGVLQELEHYRRSFFIPSPQWGRGLG